MRGDRLLTVACADEDHQSCDDTICGCICHRFIATEKRAEAAEAEVARLIALINTPETRDFLRAVDIESVHQLERWGVSHDAEKTDADWFWLIGYLAGKALWNPDGDTEKRLHRIVTIAAAARNWHATTIAKESSK